MIHIMAPSYPSNQSTQYQFSTRPNVTGYLFLFHCTRSSASANPLANSPFCSALGMNNAIPSSEQAKMLSQLTPNMRSFPIHFISFPMQTAVFLYSVCFVDFVKRPIFPRGRVGSPFLRPMRVVKQQTLEPLARTETKRTKGVWGQESPGNASLRFLVPAGRKTTFFSAGMMMSLVIVM